VSDADLRLCFYRCKFFFVVDFVLLWKFIFTVSGGKNWKCFDLLVGVSGVAETCCRLVESIVLNIVK
jgi:hypothetical protein